MTLRSSGQGRAWGGNRLGSPKFANLFAVPGGRGEGSFILYFMNETRMGVEWRFFATLNVRI